MLTVGALGSTLVLDSLLLNWPTLGITPLLEAISGRLTMFGKKFELTVFTGSSQSQLLEHPAAMLGVVKLKKH